MKPKRRTHYFVRTPWSKRIRWRFERPAQERPTEPVDYGSPDEVGPIAALWYRQIQKTAVANIELSALFMQQPRGE